MNFKMKKLSAALLAAVVCMSVLTVCVSAIVIDPKFSLGGGTKCKSLGEAFEKAAATDVILQDSNVPVYEADASVSVTKCITLKTGRDFNGRVNSIRSTVTDAPLFTVESGGVLTLRDADLGGCESSSNTAGGLIVVKNGGKLILDGTADEPVTIHGCVLTAEGAKGGAIYVEAGGKVVIHGVTFLDNAAAEGADIYAEDPADVIEGDEIETETETETTSPETVPETEPETTASETVPETAPETSAPETVPETDPQTAPAVTEPETAEPVTLEPATEAESDKPEQSGTAAGTTGDDRKPKSGCGSFVQGSAALILTAAAACAAAKVNAGKKTRASV